MTEDCALASFLKSGPGRVPLRTCCVVALVSRRGAGDCPWLDNSALSQEKSDAAVVR